MVNLKKNEIILAMVFGLSSVTLSPNAFAIGSTGTSADYGAPASFEIIDREIKLTSTTKFVNVTNGETVRFNFNGKIFAWHFDTFNEQSFDFSKIAPKDVNLDGIRVYVANNPIFG